MILNQYLFLWFELAALVVILINYRHFRQSPIRWFWLLLLLTNAVEWGNQFKLFSINHNNNWIFNILMNPFEYLFYGWFFYTLIQTKQEKRQIRLLGICLFAFVSINLLFIQGLWFFNSYSFMAGALFILYCNFLYMRQVLRNVDEYSLLRNPLFWISIGLLFFYGGYFFLMAFFEYFLKTNNFANFRPVFYFFNKALNILLYASLIISFLLRPQPTTSSPA